MKSKSPDIRTTRSRQLLAVLAAVFAVLSVFNAAMATREPSVWQWSTAGACAGVAAVLAHRWHREG